VPQQQSPSRETWKKFHLIRENGKIKKFPIDRDGVRRTVDSDREEPSVTVQNIVRFVVRRLKRPAYAVAVYENVCAGLQVFRYVSRAIDLPRGNWSQLAHGIG